MQEGGQSMDLYTLRSILQVLLVPDSSAHSELNLCQSIVNLFVNCGDASQEAELSEDVSFSPLVMCGGW